MKCPGVLGAHPIRILQIVADVIQVFPRERVDDPELLAAVVDDLPSAVGLRQQALKSELIEHMAKQADLFKAAVGRALNAMIGGVQSSLKKHKSVTITGFGTFNVSKRKARMGPAFDHAVPRRKITTRVPTDDNASGALGPWSWSPEHGTCPAAASG